MKRRPVHAFFLAGACWIAWMGAAADALAAPGSIVTVNADHVVVINGRKVFPIGFSGGPPLNGLTPDGGDAWREIREAGGTFFRTGASNGDWNDQVIADEQARLDAAAARGLFCWINLRELSTIAPGDAARESRLREVVNRFKNHPGLGFWKNFDEAAWGGQPADHMVRGYQIIHETDPHHPVVQTHAPRLTVEQLRPYNAALDVLNLDIYPIGYPPGNHSLLPNKEISMVGDWTRFLADVAEGQKSCWMTLQIAWSGVTGPGKTLRFPTFPQERFMAYQAIINGARGLTNGITAKEVSMTAEDAQLGWNWTFWRKVLRPVVEELADDGPLAPALVAADSPRAIQMTGAADVEFCVRESGRDLFILACKREGATVNVQFSGLPAWAGTGELLYEAPRKVTAVNGAFTDWFGPFEVHVYRFHNDAAGAFGDFDGDNDVDLEDFSHLQTCLLGWGAVQADPACLDADLNEDTYVDKSDVTLFIRCLRGPLNPLDPTCVD
ncbi:MAG: hypothetical protein AMXMBFR83_10040 [Phycisphaerae bacterium]